MANHHGSEGSVAVGANTVAEVLSFSVNETASFAEDTTLGDTAVTRNSTAITDWSGDLTCWWDETDTNGQEALTIGASVTLNLYPEGSATGDTYYTGTALVTDIGVSSQRGEIVERTFSFVGNGALTQTTV